MQPFIWYTYMSHNVFVYRCAFYWNGLNVIKGFLFILFFCIRAAALKTLFPLDTGGDSLSKQSAIDVDASKKFPTSTHYRSCLECSQDLPRNVRNVRNHCRVRLVLSVAGPTTAWSLHATSVVPPFLLTSERLEKEIQVKF